MTSTVEKKRKLLYNVLCGIMVISDNIVRMKSLSNRPGLWSLNYMGVYQADTIALWEEGDFV